MQANDLNKMQTKLLKDQIVLVTGSAGRIGSEIARQLLKEKSQVILADFSKERLNNLYNELHEIHNQNVCAIHADVSTKSGIEKLIKEALLKKGRIDSAIHSAFPTSKGLGDSLEELKEDNLYQDLNMQLGGAILFSQSIIKHFKQKSYGNLIHISSIQGVAAPKFDHYEGTNMTSPIEYSAIKSGIVAITKWLAKYYHSQGIRINCISPGGILDSQPTKFLENYRMACTNIGMLDPCHVAPSVVFLLSPASAALNGQNLIVDDGWTL